MENDFLMEETRCNYLVSEKMKKVWQIEITLLEEFKRICSKYNLHWWAEGGTLLGAVRHKGFIPWDDDIDICMLRKDYNKFVEVAQQEIKAPFYFLSSAVIPEYVSQFSKIKMDNTTMIVSFDDYRIGIHQGVAIDIFPMDFVTDTYEQDFATFTEMIRKCRMCRCKKLPLKKEVQECTDFLTSLKESDTVENFTIYNNTKVTRRNYLDMLDTIEVPFEYTTVVIPRNYKLALDTQYPEWETKYIKGTQRHKTTYINPDKDYKQWITL